MLFSLTKLLQVEDKSYKTFDASVLANIARTIIETHNIFQYVCEQGITDEELNLRIDLMILHESIAKQKILERFNFFEDDQRWQLSSMTQSSSIRSIKENLNSTDIDKKNLEIMCKGKKAFYFERMRTKCSSLNENLESGIYNYLSRVCQDLCVNS